MCFARAHNLCGNVTIFHFIFLIKKKSLPLFIEHTARTHIHTTSTHPSVYALAKHYMGCLFCVLAFILRTRVYVVAARGRQGSVHARVGENNLPRTVSDMCSISFSKSSNMCVCSKCFVYMRK